MNQQWNEGSIIRNYFPPTFVVGLVISLLCLWLFIRIAEATFRGEALTQVDFLIAQEMRPLMTRSLLRFFRIITAFGYQAVIVVGVVVGLYFLVRRHWAYLFVWAAALGGGALLNTLLKAWFAHPRPVISQPQITTLYDGFPSGHTLMAVITYGLLAYFLISTLLHPWQRVLVIASAVVLILFIGFSRMYLAVHYSSDVLAGFAVGGMWLSICITVLSFYEGQKQTNRRQISSK